MELLQNGIQHGSFLEVAPACPNLSCFPLFLPSSFQQEAFGCDCYCNVLSCFWAVAATTFFIQRVPDISHTPRIISSLGKSYRMAFNMALSWKWRQHVPTFHVSLYFFHVLFSKKHLVVIVIVMFCPVSVLVGWLCSYFFIRRVPDISHTPKIISHLGKSHRMTFNLALSWTRGSTMS